MSQYSSFKYLPVQWKIILVVLLVSVSTVSAVVWKTQSLVVEDKTDFLSESSVRQIAPLKRLVQAELHDSRDELVRFASTRASSGAGRAKVPGDFEVVALVQTVDGGLWSPGWVEKGAQASAERWPSEHEITLLKSLPYAKVRDGEMTWVRVSDPKGLPLYAVLFAVELGSPSPEAQSSAQAPATPSLPDAVPAAPVPSGVAKRAIVVGFTPLSPLAAVTEDYIGSLSSAVVVDDRGYVASHPNKALLGALYTEDELVEEIVRTQKSVGTGRFESRDRQSIVGHFERVDRSNLFVAITTPLEPVSALAALHRNTALATGVAVGILGLLLAWLIGRGISRPLQDTIDAIRALSNGSGEARIQAVNTNDEVGALTHLLSEAPPTAFASRPELVALADKAANGGEVGETTHTFSTSSVAFMQELSQEKLANERRSAYESFSLGLGHALREPLNSILGHAQLVRSKTTDSELASHADSIERDARRSREVVERLQGFAFSEPESVLREPTDLTAVVREVLTKIEKDLEAENITVVRELKPVPRVKGAAGMIERSLLQLVDNAREAMRDRPSKRLEIRTELLGDNVLVSVVDSGIGMSRDLKAKAFEPFAKGFQSSDRMGLGLSFVVAAMKRVGGDCVIESVPGEGSTVSLRFGAEADEKRAFLDRVVAEKARATAAEHPAVEEPHVTVTELPDTDGETDGKTGVETDEEMKFTPAALPLTELQLGDTVGFQDEAKAEEPTVLVQAHAAEKSGDANDDDDDAFSSVPLGKVTNAPPSKVSSKAKLNDTKAPHASKAAVRNEDLASAKVAANAAAAASAAAMFGIGVDDEGDGGDKGVTKEPVPSARDGFKVNIRRPRPRV